MLDYLSQFHFLRPMILFGLLALPILFILLRRKARSHDDWEKHIDPELLSQLRPQSASIKTKRFALALSFAYALSIVASAGPTWERKQVPVVTQSDDMVVILDLSISMLANDISPDRLTRSKQKLQDLLSLRKEGNTALVVFSGDAHVVTPLTDDTNTIIATLPALTPFNMPVIGSRPDLAVAEAHKLLTQASSSSGRIVMLTDGVTEQQRDLIAKMSDTVPISVLAIGSANGGPIDLGERGFLKQNGEVVIPKTDFSLLSGLAAENDGVLAKLTLDDRDLRILDIATANTDHDLNQAQSDDAPQTYDNWDDAGFWLLLVIIPLVLLSHRNGAFAIVFLLILPMDESLAKGVSGSKVPGTNAQSHSDSDELQNASTNQGNWRWQDLWQTRDQQAQQALDQGNYEKAAELFESAEHKLYSEARSNSLSVSDSFDLDLESDSPLDKEDDSTGAKSDFYYNKGTALAQQGQFEPALAALDKALELDSNNDDAAFNRKIIEEILKSQEQQEGQEGQPDSDQPSSDQENSDNSDSQNNDQSQDQSQQDQSQQGDSQENSEGQSNSDQEQDSSEQSSSQSQNQESQESQSSDQQAEQQNEAEGQEQNSENASANPNDETDSESQAREAQELLERQAELDAQAEAQIAAQDTLSDEEKQSFEQWMRRVPDDPGGLLRRKFEYQSQQRNRQTREEGQPLW